MLKCSSSKKQSVMCIAQWHIDRQSILIQAQNNESSPILMSSKIAENAQAFKAEIFK